MKKIKFCLAGTILALSVLSGCGMANDGFVEDTPRSTSTPMESPYISASPMPTQMPAQTPTQSPAQSPVGGDQAENGTVEESPSPDEEQSTTSGN